MQGLWSGHETTMVKRGMSTSHPHPSLNHLSDAELLAETKRLATHERGATVGRHRRIDRTRRAQTLSRRRMCVVVRVLHQVLHFSEQAAYSRIEAARVARRVPQVLDLLIEGALTLTTVGLLAPHVTPENQSTLIAATRNRSKREVERAARGVSPAAGRAVDGAKLPAPRHRGRRPRSTVRRTQSRRAWLESQDDDVLRPRLRHHVPRNAPSLVPLAPERYKVQVTISKDAHDHLRRAQNLLRHVIPSGDPAAIVERALALLVADLERKKLAATTSPRPVRTATPGSRHIPAAVKREVWARDEGRCAFVGGSGALHRARIPRVASHDSVCRRWSVGRHESAAALPCSQRLGGGVVVRRDRRRGWRPRRGQLGPDLAMCALTTISPPLLLGDLICRDRWSVRRGDVRRPDDLVTPVR